MENREIVLEIEDKLSKLKSVKDDTAEFRNVIVSSVNLIEYELGLPKKLCISFVRNIILGYTKKLSD